MKKFTCIDDLTCINNHEGKVDGAIEGTKEEVLEWMRGRFPGLHERGEEEIMSAIEFFHEGEIKAYKTAQGETVYLAEIKKKEVKKAKKRPAIGKKTAVGKTGANVKPMWVWALDYEDINELERDFSVWRSQASAKARMEKEIRHLSDMFHGKIEREDDLHAVLKERFYWSIRKIKVHGDQDIDM